MMVVVIIGNGGYDKLVYCEEFMLKFEVGEVFLCVLVVGVNNIEINMWFGWYFFIVIGDMELIVEV